MLHARPVERHLPNSHSERAQSPSGIGFGRAGPRARDTLGKGQSTVPGRAGQSESQMEKLSDDSSIQFTILLL